MFLPKPTIQPMNGYPVMNPYPKQNAMPKQPGGMQSFINSFKSQDGSVDFNKMVNTAGQMMNAVTQVSSLVKGLGGIFKVLDVDGNKKDGETAVFYLHIRCI